MPSLSPDDNRVSGACGACVNATDEENEQQRHWRDHGGEFTFHSSTFSNIHLSAPRIFSGESGIPRAMESVDFHGRPSDRRRAGERGRTGRKREKGGMKRKRSQSSVPLLIASFDVDVK